MKSIIVLAVSFGGKKLARKKSIAMQQEKI